MKYLKHALVCLIPLSICAVSLSAELSSKAKKAEKLAAAGKLAEAVEIYKALLAKDPQKDAGLVKEGRDGMAAVLVIQGKKAFDEKKYDDARGAGMLALKEYPEAGSSKEASRLLVSAQMELGAKLMADGKFEECSRQCKDILAIIVADTDGIAELKGMLADASVKLAAAMYHRCMDQGDLPGALAAARQASDIEPNNSGHKFKIIELLYEMGKADEAQKSAAALLGVLQEEAKKAYQKKEVVQYMLGKVQMILGNYTEAAVEFDKALARNPSMLDAKRGLAMAQFSDKNYSGAIATYDVLLNQYAGIFSEASAASAADKDSMELARRLEDLRKETAFFHYQKGLALEQMGDYEKALVECRLGLEGVPTQEAAATLKRIQNTAQKKTESIPAPAPK